MVLVPRSSLSSPLSPLNLGPPHAFSLAPPLNFSPLGVFPQDFKWSLIQEAIATAEGIDFSEVPSFLLRENPVVWT